MWRSWVLLGLWCALGWGSAWAEPSADCYAAGTAELEADPPRYDLAGAAFEGAARLDVCRASADLLMASAAHAYREQAKVSVDPRWYCKARDAWRRVVELTRDQRRLETARARAAEDAADCPGPAQPVPPPTQTSKPQRRKKAKKKKAPAPSPESDDDTTPWLIAGGVAAAVVGVGVIVWLATDDAPAVDVNSIELALEAAPR